MRPHISVMIASFNRLESIGFKLWNIIPGFCSGETGRMLQMGGVFPNISPEEGMA